MVREWNKKEKWIELTRTVVGEIENPKEICIICGSRAELLHHPFIHEDYASFNEYLNEICLTPFCIRCHHLLHRYPTEFIKFMKIREHITEKNVTPRVPESCYNCRYAVIKDVNQDTKIKCLKQNARVISRDDMWLCRSYRKRITNDIVKIEKKNNYNQSKYYNSRKPWTGEEDRILTNEWLGGVSNRKIGYKLGRSLSSVNSRVLRLKIFEYKVER